MAEEQLIPIADVTIDLPEVSERLFLGPQGALIEKIDSFNTNFCENKEVIRITKNFNFKPGTYNRIKEAHGQHVLKYNMPPRSMWNLADRISRNDYLNRRFWEEAKAIHSMMHNLKWNNSGWQDNTQVVEDFWEIWIERLTNEIAEANDMFPNTEVNIYIDNNVLNDVNRWKEMNVIIEVLTKDIQLNIMYQNDTICEYDWGNIATRWRVPIWKFLNNWCEGGPQQTNIMGYTNPNGKIYPKYQGLAHPYVSRINRRWDNSFDVNPGWMNNTCTGGHQSDLGAAVWKMDIMPLVVLTRTWLSKYHIPNTNPLNRIEHCIYGMPEKASAELWKHRSSMTPERVMSECKWPNEYRQLLHSATDTLGRLFDPNNILNCNNPCDKCQFKDIYTWQNNDLNVIEVNPCNYAIFNYIEPETDDEAIKEACIIHLMVCDYMRNQETLMNEAGFTDIRITETNRFPIHAELSNIYATIGDEFHLEYYMHQTILTYHNQDHESLLDNIFGTQIFHELITDLVYLIYGDENFDDDFAAVEDEWNGATLQELRDEITRIDNRHEAENTPRYNPVEESLTTEERAIRWATSRGSAINI